MYGLKESGHPCPEKYVLVHIWYTYPSHFGRNGPRILIPMGGGTRYSQGRVGRVNQRVCCRYYGIAYVLILMLSKEATIPLVVRITNTETQWLIPACSTWCSTAPNSPRKIICYWPKCARWAIIQIASPSIEIQSYIRILLVKVLNITADSQGFVDGKYC